MNLDPAQTASNSTSSESREVRARQYPRVLFVTSHAFNHVTGGGVTFSNLFRGWPAACLSTVHDDTEPTSDDVCRQYYQLGPRELDYVWPLGAMRRRMRGAANNGRAGVSIGGTQGSSLRRQLITRVLGEAPPQRARLTPELERWIARFKPELLYTILGGNALMDLIESIRERFSLPLVVHIMDDWPSASHRKGLLAPFEQRRMRNHVRRFFACAARCLAISDAMAEAYQDRYGGSFEAFQNTIEVAARRAPPRDLAVGAEAQILYVGSIFENAQLASLIDCAKAVAMLAESGRPVRLTIASPAGQGERYRHLLEVHPAVRVEGPITDDDEFFRRIGQADLLLLPVNFDAQSVTFIRYSMPTKVPAYLVSGTPILGYGPAGVAQISYAKDADWALVVEREGVAELANAMTLVLDDVGLRQQLTAHALAAAVRNHDAARVRVRFQQCLREAARAA